MTSKVSLRQSIPSDADFFYQMMQNKDFQKYYLSRLLIKSKEEAEKYIKDAEKKASTGYSYCYTILFEKKPVGIMEIYKVNNKDKRAAIGYGVAREYWGKGITTKAIKLALKIMKTELKTHTCEAAAHPKNIPSCKVLENNGFEKVGIAKDYYFDGDKFVDRVLYWKVL
jgi:RimJ/RimL family protein N-acetyltransferase